jgi:hypothetical protein
MKNETREVLDLMYEAIEPVPFNLLTPPELSTYSEDELICMVQAILAEPRDMLPLDRAALAAINSELSLRDTLKAQRNRYEN